MAAVTLATLRARVRARADMENSSFVADSADSLDAFINSALLELYEMLVEGDADRYVSPTPYAINLVAGTDIYALPADFMSLSRVDVLNGSDYVPLGRAKRDVVYGRTTTVLTALKYALRKDKLQFVPTPGAAGSARLFYVPQLAPLAAPGENFDSVNGWERFVIARAALDCLDKEESDTSVVSREVELQRQRIIRLATKRNVDEVARVQDRTASAYGFDEDELLPP